MKHARPLRSNSTGHGPAPRKTLFELPPLELECMKVLWALEEASVRDIREQLAAEARPLAYTTVETIMDRLTRKGAVVRRKLGRAHRYTPVYRQADARAQAVDSVVRHFFEGSRPALLAHLSGSPTRAPERVLGAGSSAKPRPRVAPAASRPAPAADARTEAPIDTSLL